MSSNFRSKVDFLKWLIALDCTKRDYVQTKNEMLIKASEINDSIIKLIKNTSDVSGEGLKEKVTKSIKIESKQERLELEEIVYDRNSEIYEGKIGVPWVEALVRYLELKNAKKVDPMNLLLEIGESFKEEKKPSLENRVVYYRQFEASRLPSVEEVNTAVEIYLGKHPLVNYVNERVKDRVTVNGFEIYDHLKVLHMIDFEISGLAGVYDLLGQKLIRNKNENKMYGYSKHQLYKIGMYGETYPAVKVTSGEFNGDFGFTNLF